MQQKYEARKDLNVRNSINAIFVGIDEDGGNSKAKEDKGAKESDLSDRNEPGYRTINTMREIKDFFQILLGKFYFKDKLKNKYNNKH